MCSKTKMYLLGISHQRLVPISLGDVSRFKGGQADENRISAIPAMQCKIGIYNLTIVEIFLLKEKLWHGIITAITDLIKTNTDRHEVLMEEEL